ncbi:28S ribosomal protein S11, mitochondrial isoform X2 [Hemicordylus capensis]|uniref:28S ribosomal protein S11, mitochondrial isoform X2 n=1 Tax=Hemicordylus capensis TaxID=884348 RepID=UPI0023033DF0|nr:28S ribosomal protein S11, mitochondrial isoform X2 [Hemicordylus capensis]
MIPTMAIARRGFLVGCSGGGITLSRGMQTVIQNLQGSAEDSATPAAEVPEIQSRGHFRLFPPAPGRESVLRWAGKKFEEIPIAHIKATYNNTHIQVLTAENVPLALSTCGTEGFKNIKKATAIAAQTTGIAAAAKASAKGVSHVRVVVKGMGPGRLVLLPAVSRTRT